MKLFTLLMMSMSLLIIDGCASMTRNIYDKDGKIVATEKFDGDLSTAVVFDLKDKIVFQYCSGIVARLKVSPPDKENPTGTLTCEFVDANEGYMSIPKDCNFNKDMLSAFSDMIAAAGSPASKDLSLTPAGATTSGGK
jgi:hypothetical protein